MNQANPKQGVPQDISTSQSSNSFKKLVDMAIQKNQIAENQNASSEKQKPVIICSIDTFSPTSGFIHKLRSY